MYFIIHSDWRNSFRLTQNQEWIVAGFTIAYSLFFGMGIAWFIHRSDHFVIKSRMVKMSLLGALGGLLLTLLQLYGD